MLINTATKPNLLWFMQIITLLNKSKNSFCLLQRIRAGLMAFAFRSDLLQLYWWVSCMMTFGGLMSAQGWLQCKTQLTTCKGTAKLLFFVSTLFLSAMEHALMSCSFSSWFEGKIWTKLAPAKTIFHCCGLTFITKNVFFLKYFLEKSIMSFQISVWWGWRESPLY